MADGRRPAHRQDDDELFIPRPSSATPDSPTVGPLRINKNSMSPPSSRSASAQNPTDRYQQPLRSQASPAPPTDSRPPYPDDHQRIPTFAAPPTSSIDRGQTPEIAGAGNNTRRTGTPQQRPTSGRFKFSADDPNRPTVSGYSHTQKPSTGSRSAEQRNGTPKPLPDSPGPETPDKDELGPPYPRSGLAYSGNPAPYPHEQYEPPRPIDTTTSNLHVLEPNSINRFGSTASVSTTKASRGSPPPPETPLTDRRTADRWAAATPPIPSTAGIHAQGAASAQRASPYGPINARQGAASPAQQQQENIPTRAWSPNQRPGEHLFGPTALSQGAQGSQNMPAPSAIQPGLQSVPSQPLQSQQPAAYPQPQPTQPGQAAQVGQPGHSIVSGQDMQRLNVQDEPPPAYSTVPQAGPRTTSTGGVTAQGYPADKRTSFAGQAVPAAAIGAAAGLAAAAQVPGASPDPSLQQHPAFANDPHRLVTSISPSHPAAAGLAPVQTGLQQPLAIPSMATVTSPPLLPEGWIAHLDQNSGQYYYIHLPTQSTQWEFPKGPTPLNMQEPMSPAGSFAQPMASPAYSSFQKPMMSPGFPSPGFPTQHAYHRESMASMATLASPNTAGFTGPPPAAGVDLYKVAPTNGVYFGPYLRYTNIDLERSLWLGSILLVTDAAQPPTIHLHQSVDLSPNPRQLKANPIYSHQRYLFYRYDIDVVMDDQPAKWTYAITSHLGCTRYEFSVAGRYETAWKFITHSGNDFALGVSANERAKLGGVSMMWKDVLQKHQECGGFHVQLGLGGQIYADRLWQDVPMLKQWTTMSGKENRKNAQWTAKHEEDVIHAYFHYYTSHFDQPHLREAFAQIPHVLTLDDHDIFDGYGSYPEYMQQSHIFKNIGRIGIEMYLLFQQHTTHEILRNVNNDLDLFTITGTGWHFLKFLGPAVVVVGPDTRSERTTNQVLAGPTYQGLFPKVAMLPPSVQHCIWMLPVPLLYPRLHSAQQIAQTMATGKKAVTGTFNMLGKVTSSVAGIVGAKDVVNDGFSQVKRAVGKSGLMSGMLNPFGELEALDELRDLWTHESKDLERTYLIRTLQGISHNKSVRMTFLSGSVNCAGAGLVHDPAHPQDHKTMYQLISSSIVNAPPSSLTLRLLNTNPKVPIYIPPNGRRSSTLRERDAGVGQNITDTKEDMMEIFIADPNGTPREMKRLMGRRNYVAMVVFDPEQMNQQYGTNGHAHDEGQKSSGRLSIAADFLVQHGEGGYGGSVKYGPVVIPSVEYGR